MTEHELFVLAEHAHWCAYSGKTAIGQLLQKAVEELQTRHSTMAICSHVGCTNYATRVINNNYYVCQEHIQES